METEAAEVVPTRISSAMVAITIPHLARLEASDTTGLIVPDGEALADATVRRNTPIPSGATVATVDASKEAYDRAASGTPSEVPETTSATLQIRATGHGPLSPRYQMVNPGTTREDPLPVPRPCVEHEKERGGKASVHPVGLGDVASAHTEGIGEECPIRPEVASSRRSVGESIRDEGAALGDLGLRSLITGEDSVDLADLLIHRVSLHCTRDISCSLRRANRACRRERNI